MSCPINYFKGQAERNRPALIYTVFCLSVSCDFAVRCETLKGAIAHVKAACLLGHDRCAVSLGGEMVLLP